MGIEVHSANYEKRDGTGFASISIEGPPDQLIERAREVFQLFLGGQGIWRITALTFVPVEEEPHRWLMHAKANLIKDDADFAMEAELEEPSRIHEERPA